MRNREPWSDRRRRMFTPGDMRARSTPDRPLDRLPGLRIIGGILGICDYPPTFVSRMMPDPPRAQAPSRVEIELYERRVRGEWEEAFSTSTCKVLKRTSHGEPSPAATTDELFPPGCMRTGAGAHLPSAPNWLESTR